MILLYVGHLPLHMACSAQVLSLASHMVPSAPPRVIPEHTARSSKSRAMPGMVPNQKTNQNPIL